jgi:hypothetical protein
MSSFRIGVIVVLVIVMIVGLGMTMSRTEFGPFRGFQEDNAIGSTANSLKRLESLPVNLTGCALAVTAALMIVAVAVRKQKDRPADDEPSRIPGPVERVANQAAQVACKQVAKASPAKPARSLDQVLEDHVG